MVRLLTGRVATPFAGRGTVARGEAPSRKVMMAGLGRGEGEVAAAERVTVWPRVAVSGVVVRRRVMGGGAVMVWVRVPELGKVAAVAGM